MTSANLNPDLKKCQITKAGTILLPVGRMLYPNLFVARAMPGEPSEKAKYSVSIILPEDSDLSIVVAAVERLTKEAWGVGKSTKPVRKPFLRYSEKTDDADLAARFPVLVRTGSTNAPQVIAGSMDPVTDSAEVYAGRWARVSVRPYTWDHPTGGRGVSLGLSNVQILDHDDPIGRGRVKVDDEFEPIAGAPGGNSGTSSDSLFN